MAIQLNNNVIGAILVVIGIYVFIKDISVLGAALFVISGIGIFLSK